MQTINKKEQNQININDIYNDIYDVLNKKKQNKITGEIISFKITNNNAWINIKVDGYQFTGIFWKINQDKNFKDYISYSQGDKIIFDGSFSILKSDLRIYFNIKSMNKSGLGDYMQIYDNYRLQVIEKGMNLNKKKLSIFPYNIGIITSLEGAAVQDILQTFKLDKFIGNIIIKNSLVQGKQCSQSIINSIEWFENNYNKDNIHILMITRGGGSFEDLVGFSDWNLLEKIYQTGFLTFSAVGHQIDNQLSDEVADYKFATPSIGAKYIVERQQSYFDKLLNCKKNIKSVIELYNQSKNKFSQIESNYNTIINNFEIKEKIVYIRKYSSTIKKLLNKYNNVKQEFYANLANIKPTIMRKEEITSINDFIDKDSNKEINPKKVEIFFVDGSIKLYYKIIDYERY